MFVYVFMVFCFDVLVCCEVEFEVMMSDYESGDDGYFEEVIILFLDFQQYMEV